jgi:hypothetical protein
MSTTRKLTPEQYERERLATEHERSLRGVLPPINVESAIDEVEFREVFGRWPDAYDRRLGLRRVLDLHQQLMSLRHS